MTGKTRMTVRVHLKSGQTIKFTAETIKSVRDKVTGEIDELQWTGAEGEVPQHFGPSAIAAVTVEHVYPNPEEMGV